MPEPTIDGVGRQNESIGPRHPGEHSPEELFGSPSLRNWDPSTDNVKIQHLTEGEIEKGASTN